MTIPARRLALVTTVALMLASSSPRPRHPLIGMHRSGAASKSLSSAAGLRFESNLGQIHDRSSFITRGAGYVVSLTGQEASFRFRSAGVVGMKFLGANPHAQLAGDELLTARSHYFRGHEAAAWVANVPNYRRVIGRDLYHGIDVVYYGHGNHLEFDLLVHPGADADDVDLKFDGGQLRLDEVGDLRLTIAAGELRIGRPSVFEERGRDRVVIPAAYEPHEGNVVHVRLGRHDSAHELVVDPLITYSTFLGGDGDDYARAVAVSDDGSAFVTGSTDSVDFPSTPDSRRHGAGDTDAFVVKFSPAGELLYSVFLGGASEDRGEGIVVDGAGSAYVTGATSSRDFPTRNAFQKTFGGNSDAFIAKLSPSGSALEYATYLGGSGFDSARGAAVDADGNLITMGQTLSTDFPTRNPRQPHLAGQVDAFVAKLDAAGGLVFSTYHGGSLNDLPFFVQGTPLCNVGPIDAPGWAVGVDSQKFIYVTGTTESTDFPTAHAFQSEHKGGLRDAFVSKFSPDGSTLVYSTYIGGSGGDSARGLAVDAFGNTYVTGGTKSPDFPITAGAPHSTKSVDYDAFVLKLDPDGQHILFSSYLGGSGSEGGNAIGVDPHGNAFFVGHTTSADLPVTDRLEEKAPNNSNLFVASVNASDSSMPFAMYLGGGGDETPCGVNMGLAMDPVGTAYVAAATSSTDFPITSGAHQTTPAGRFDAFLTAFRSEPRIQIDVLHEGDQNRLIVTIGNPGAGHTVELKLWLDWPARISAPIALLTTSIEVPTRMVPTRVIDTTLPSDFEFPGTIVGVRLIDPGTGLVLDQSICRDSPCR